MLGCDVVGLGGVLVWEFCLLKEGGRAGDFAYGGCGAEGGDGEDEG